MGYMQSVRAFGGDDWELRVNTAESEGREELCVN